jgi:beta-glucosidase
MRLFEWYHRCTNLRLLVLLVVYLPGTVIAQTLEERITAIIGQMTLQEKILQLHQEGGMNTADNTRLGIPGFLMADGPHGVREGSATSFPVGIGMAAMWDTAMARQIGVAMGKEFRGKGKHQALGPALDIDRDPRNGRSPETGGEDPYLCAQITTAVVKGMQSTPIIATIKHYNANHRENGRTTNNISASDRVLHEDAGLAFRTAVQMGGAFSVMNAYNLINGEKCAENGHLLTTILRTQWGFPYYVVSDWGSIWSSKKAIEAGCDICMGSDNYRDDLPGLVSGGSVAMSTIDAAVRRVLRTKLIAGMLDHQPSGDPADVNSPAHQVLCREAARKSLVLLKNEGGILPLSTTTVPKIALIGPHAATLVVDGSGSAYVTPFYTVSPMQGIVAIAGASNVAYAKGCDINSADTSGFAAATSLAATADVVIFCGGLDGGQEGEGFDRVGSSTALPGKQQDLVNRVAAVNPHVIGVIFSGGICSLERCVDKLQGLIYAFYPGQEAGGALGDALFGTANPAGRLPVTMPRGDVQLPSWNDDLDDDYGCGYRWFDMMSLTPRFPFGYGLSYTSFSYSNITVSSAQVDPGVPVTVTVQVQNTGSRAGDEVVQLYLSHVAPVVPMPVKALKGFRRVRLEPGQMTEVSFTLTADELYFFNDNTAIYEVMPGKVQVKVGGSSASLPLAGEFTVLAGTLKPDLLITNIRTVPPYPHPGDAVTCVATVKNQGSGPTTAGVPVHVSFSVNGESATIADDVTASIPVGGMALVTAVRGASGAATWTAGPVGSYPIVATVDPANGTAECVETNNVATAVVNVVPVPPANLALNKTVSVTSIEGAGLEGKNAVDGNMGTRWSSAFSDPQVLTIDLGARAHIDDVVLYWEAAYGKEYSVRIAEAGGAWVDVAYITNGDGGMDRISVGANGSRVMILGTQRATPYGYSLYEVEVHGGAPTDVVASGTSLPATFALDECYPNPFNGSSVVGYQLPVASNVRIIVYDLLGREIAILTDGLVPAGRHTVRFDASAVSSGAYLVRMEAAGIVLTQKALLVR